ncbi:MAG: hypothetical protein OHK006_03920 [Thermodesulfovibrionales bacterium]
MKKVVLLVEDDEPLRAVTREALERDFAVVEAAGCDEAQAEDLERVDIAVIDYMLPGCDGLSLLKNLRVLRPGLPAVIMTAYSTENLVIKALRAGATDYIRKPVRFSFLREKIREILVESSSADAPETAVSRDAALIEGIIEYIEGHYGTALSLEKLASLGGMNKYRFCRAFKKQTGKSYTAYLNSVRIRNSLELVKNTDLPITDISNAVGYSCLTYFERIFKSRTGMTPKEYRRRERIGGEENPLP